jgi:hypothetical protein
MMSVAGAWLERQQHVLDKIKSDMASSRLLAFVEHIAFDEAKQVLALGFRRELQRDQIRSAWQVLLQTRVAEWLVEGDVQPRRLTLIMPPVVLVGAINADAFYDGVFCSTAAQMLHAFFAFRRKLAAYSFGLNSM